MNQSLEAFWARGKSRVLQNRKNVPGNASSKRLTNGAPQSGSQLALEGKMTPAENKARKELNRAQCAEGPGLTKEKRQEGQEKGGRMGKR